MPLNLFKRKPKVVRGLEIDEVSVVAAAANPLAKVVLRKRDRAALIGFDNAVARLALSVRSIINDDGVADKNTMLGRSFAQYLDHVNGLTKTRTRLADVTALHRIFGKNTDVPADDLDLDEDEKRRAAQAAYAGGDDDAGDGSHHAGDGGSDGDGESRDMLERSRRAMKGLTTMQTREQELSDFTKRHGIAALARSVNRGGAFVSEEEFSKLLQEDCARTGRDFSKAIEGGRNSDADTIEIAKAWRCCSDAGFASQASTMHKAAGMPGVADVQPRVAGGADAQAVNSPAEAMVKLRELVAAERAAQAALSESDAWQKVFTHPDNRALAEATYAR